MTLDAHGFITKAYTYQIIHTIATPIYMARRVLVTWKQGLLNVETYCDIKTRTLEDMETLKLDLEKWQKNSRAGAAQSLFCWTDMICPIHPTR